MPNFMRYFNNPFYNKQFSLAELRKYGANQKERLLSDPPDDFSEVIAHLTACLAEFDATFPDIIGAEGDLGGAVVGKKLFLKGMPARITRIWSGIGAAYGNPSAELVSAFPHGRKWFQEGEDVDRLAKFTALKEWFTAPRTSAVGATHKTAAEGLVTEWTAIWNALNSSKGDLEAGRGSRDEAKKEFQDCLFDVLLALARKFPNDEDKYQQYVPAHLLEDAGSSPEAVTLEGSFDSGDSLVHFTKSGGEGATEFRLDRKQEGEPEFSENGPVDGDTFTRGDLAPGTYYFRLAAINEVGETFSEVVTVVVP